MPPSATYTTCPYIRRDGQINPDTQTLPSHNLLLSNTASFYNAIAYSITRSQTYSDNVLSSIRTMFIDPETAIKPNARYAQVVRGLPGDQEGGYEGVLDFRGLVGVANAVMVMRGLEVEVEGWKNVDERLKWWVGEYLGWLQSSVQGKNASEAKK
jgi:hypothetical protein